MSLKYEPSACQMFVKQMSKEFKSRDPDSKQSDNMKKMGELWRQTSADDRLAWKVLHTPSVWS